MYEHRSHRLLTRTQFAVRMARHGGLAVLAIAGALFIGVLGYRELAGLSWIDALLNASMILGGMGPVDPLKSEAAKVFASVYALFSGVVFLVVVGVLVAPIFHRFLHKFHLEGEE